MHCDASALCEILLDPQCPPQLPIVNCLKSLRVSRNTETTQAGTDQHVRGKYIETIRVWPEWRIAISRHEERLFHSCIAQPL
jgi:hypothetical protein